MPIWDYYGNLLCKGIPSGSWTDTQCINAFMSYMTAKCAKYGMTGTVFANPSGLTLDSTSTPQDMLKLGAALCSYPNALDFWSTPSRSFEIVGPQARSLSISNDTITDYTAILSPAGYKFLGGKGGSLTMSGYDRSMIAIIDIENIPVLISLMARGSSSYNNRIYCVKEMCDMMKAVINGQIPTQGTYLNTLIADGGGYAACAAPDQVAAYLNLETPAELRQRDIAISASPTVSRRPASATKNMTMICALDFIDDIWDTLTVKTSDITGGSGSTYYAGDVMSWDTAFRIIMMESSNTIATAIARSIGMIILAKGVD